jgi:Flp pilus assembly protein TadD
VDFGKAIELGPKNIESYKFRARCLELLGEGERAEADKRKAEELKKNRSSL